MTTRQHVIGLVDRIILRNEWGKRGDFLTIDQLKDELCAMLVQPEPISEETIASAIADAEADVERREALVREACLRFGGQDQVKRAELEEFMREALELPPAEWPGEVCEGSSDADPCGPVKHHDSEGNSLCKACFDNLIEESVAATAAAGEEDDGS